MTIYQPLQIKRSNIPNHKPASLAEGEIAANTNDGILFLGLEDNTVVKFYNSTNFYDENAQFDSSVSDGDVVYKASDGIYYQALADGSEKSNVVGIADVTNGRVISQGFISTNYSFNINDKVYLSQDTPGAMTNTPTIVSLGIYLGNGVILIAGRGGGSSEGLPYRSKLTLSSRFVVPDDYGCIVPERYVIEDGGELVIEGSGVFMVVDNE